MAREPQESPEERVRRSVARTLANVTRAAGLARRARGVGVLRHLPARAGSGGGDPALRQVRRTPCREPGLRWHLPPPIEDHEIVNVASIDREEFGYATRRRRAHPGGEARSGDADQRREHRAPVLRGAVPDQGRLPGALPHRRPAAGAARRSAGRGARGGRSQHDRRRALREARHRRDRNPGGVSRRRSITTSRGSRCSASSCRTCSRPSRCGPPSTTCSAPCRTATAPSTRRRATRTRCCRSRARRRSS